MIAKIVGETVEYAGEGLEVKEEVEEYVRKWKEKLRFKKCSSLELGSDGCENDWLGITRHRMIQEED